jgi:HK97 family phage major capsid protein
MVATADPKSVEQRMAHLSEQLDKLGTEFHTQSRGGINAIGYFEQDQYEPQISGRQIKSAGRNPVRRLRTLPQGYKGQFKSLSDFLRMGMTAPEKFEATYKSAVTGICKSFGLNTYQGEAGGVLVTPEYAPSIMDREYTNDLWGRTNNFQVAGHSMAFPKVSNSSRLNGQRSGGLYGFWTGEENPIATASPAFESLQLKLKKLAVAVFATEEMLDDQSYILENWIGQAVRREFDFLLGDSLFRGNGVTKPLGFLNAPGTIVVPKESGQANFTVLSENILKMWARRPAGQPLENLVWTVNQEVEAVLPLMVLGTGGNSALTYMPAGGLSGSPYATLMGRPIIPTEFNSGLGTQGDIALTDFSQMLSISKGGLREEVSTEVEFLRDLKCFKFTMRVDAKPIDDKPITPYQGTATQSAFIVLADRKP